MPRRLEVLVLRGLLLVLGALMALASRRSRRFRRQVTRDVLIEISSADGARRRFALHAGSRTLTLPRAADGRPPDCALRFATARDGLRTLLSPRAVGRIVEGMNFGGTRIEGNPALLLWFHGLTRIVAPIGRTRRPRRAIPTPVRAPERVAAYAARITREPAVAGLTRDWPEAWRARDTLLQVRAAEGDRLPPG